MKPRPRDDHCPPISYERGEMFVDCRSCAICQDCIPGHEKTPLLVSWR